MNVREQADRTSHAVGTLEVGERAQYLGAAPGWLRVRRADGTSGFVSAAWTRIVPRAPEASPARRRRRKPFLSRLLEGFRRLSWSRPANVEVVIRDPDAAQTVYRNTDPDLPVAAFAGKLATQAGIRINAFALGENAVTRSMNDAVKRMARRTGGSHTALENPGEVVSVLQSTPFSMVDRVQIVNRTTGQAMRYTATGIEAPSTARFRCSTARTRSRWQRS